ncbi:trypsin-like peptidase domain-containing protein [Amycolatopsis orientalis]|uniref:trypsin-like peptidase domain-containing protein n=1 Tax=Amycolatopsis orientalis TaxID=31958 RepID=UPI00040B367A|nr:trypsin-like peptidase domain-containing protein [Amycolatopsis orientalis]
MIDDGPSRNRVAEIIVTYPGGRRRGSGYQVAAHAVLTAAHVVVDATNIEVRFEVDLPGERSVVAASFLVAPRADLALLELPSANSDVEPVEFGRLRDEPAVLEVTAVGFPLWKLRDYGTSGQETDHVSGRYRDSYQLSGSLAVLSNWREGTLEITARTIPEAGENSPWAGMSGAAVWVSGRIIGVIAEHHRSDGPSTLAAGRFDHALAEFPREKLARLLPSLPTDAALLSDVVPLPLAQVTVAEHRSDLVDAAPDQLFERGRELTELTRFCAGNEQVRWLQAGPWAGKTALLAWFALNPPAGVDVVAFLINGRYAAEADSEGFLASMIDQLSALCGEPAGSLAPRNARRVFRRLLDNAAKRSAERGRRLLMLIDGLDEDTSFTGNREMSSIAAVLPSRLPDGVKLLVASRPHPGLPDDVVGTHPLRTVVPSQVTTSPHARNIEIAAQAELSGVLRKTGLERTLLGLIAASGGGLTAANLAELTDRPLYEVQTMLNGRFGRVLMTRHATDGSGAPERGHLLAHATLRAEAVEQFGATLADHKKVIDTWADLFAGQGWPADTPGYLLRGYPKILDSPADAPRLLSLATDARRLDLMFRATGGDMLARADIERAMALQLSKPEPSLEALLILASTADDLSRRNAKLPVDLPAVWTILGQPERAVALAGGAASPVQRIAAMRAIIESSAATRTSEWRILLPLVERALSEIVNPRTLAEQLGHLSVSVFLVGDRRRAADYLSTAIRMARRADRGAGLVALLSGLSEAAAFNGDRETAQSLAAALRTTPVPAARLSAKVFVNKATGLAAAGEYGEAMSLIAHLEDSDSAARAVSSIASVAAVNGDLSYAANLARSIKPNVARARACCEVAASIAAYGDPEQARALCREAVAAAAAVNELTAHVRALCDATDVLIDVGDRTVAFELTREIGAKIGNIAKREVRARALSRLAGLTAKLGDHAGAAELADRAEESARFSTATPQWLRVVGEVADGLAALGDYDEALMLTESVRRTIDEFNKRNAGINQEARKLALTHAIAVYAAADRLHLAEEIFESLPPGSGGKHIIALAAAKAAETGDSEFALRLCRTFQFGPHRLAAIGQVVTALARVDPASANVLFREAIDSLDRSGARDRAFAVAELAVAAAALGHTVQSRQLADSAGSELGALSHSKRVRALAAIAAAWARLGEEEHCAIAVTAAIDAASSIREFIGASRVLGNLVRRVVDADPRTVRYLAKHGISLRRILIDLVSGGYWPGAISGVTVLEPDALRALAGRIQSRLPRSS